MASPSSIPNGPDVASLGIVIPTLNEAQELPKLLATLQDQLTPRDRVVVADGGSRDETCATARRAGAEVLDAPPGRGSQLSAGARGLTQDVLLFLHADARLAPGGLGAVRRAFQGSDLVAAGMCQKIDARAPIYRWIERAADLRVRFGRIYGDSGLAVRRTAYEAVGGFRSMPLFEDVELSRRLRRHGRVELVRDAVLTISARRWEREGVLRATVRNWLLTLAFGAGVDPARLVRYYPRESPLESP